MGIFQLCKNNIFKTNSERQAETANQKKLGGGSKYFVFSPLPGEMIQFDYGKYGNIF